MCGEVITETLVNEIKDVNIFTVLADEATDCSIMEQMAIVLRFINHFFKVKEEFLGFIPCTNGLSGEALSAEIKNFIGCIALRMEERRGQVYDRAGNMARTVIGTYGN